MLHRPLHSGLFSKVESGPLIDPVDVPFVINGAAFDGSTYLSRGADLTGNADGKKGTIAFSTKWNNLSGTSFYFLCNSNNRIRCLMEIVDKFRIYCVSATPTNLVYMQSTSTYTKDDGVINLIASWDVSLGNAGTHLYIGRNGADPISDKTNGSNTVDGTIDYTGTEVNIGTNIGNTLPLNGSLKFLYANFAEYVDLSVESNRRKFFDANGNPVNMGSDGALPTGIAPIIFLQGTYDQWENNKGSGGGFTVTGALTQPAQ